MKRRHSSPGFGAFLFTVGLDELGIVIRPFEVVHLYYTIVELETPILSDKSISRVMNTCK